MQREFPAQQEDPNNDIHADLALIRENQHLRHQLEQLQNERDNQQRELTHQQEEQNRNNRTIANGMCPVCYLEFPDEQSPAGVRMMCGVEGHFMCDDCFGNFVRDQSSVEHCFDNEGKIPGCYDRDCQNQDQPLQAFDERIIAIHAPGEFQRFINGQRLFMERRIFEEQRRREEEERRRIEEERRRDAEERERVENGVRRLRQQIADLYLIFRCPNGHQWNLEEGCGATVCTMCHHGFCVICGFDAGYHGDAHQHVLQVHGDFFANALDPTLAYRTNAPRVQREIINLLQQEENEIVQREIIDEIANRGEYDLWREYFDMNAIRRAVNASQPAVVDHLVGGYLDNNNNENDEEEINIQIAIAENILANARFPNNLAGEYTEDWYNSRLFIDVTGNRFAGTYNNGQGRINGVIINGDVENCQWVEGERSGNFIIRALTADGFECDCYFARIWRIRRVRPPLPVRGGVTPAYIQPPPVQNDYGFLRQGRQEDLPDPNGLPVDNGGY